MIPALRLVQGVDTRLTQDFLLNQPGILDASVWMSEGRLCAHVTLEDEAGWTQRELKSACAIELGLHQTPSEFVMRLAKLRAA
jgi:hypothetical protein